MRAEQYRAKAADCHTRAECAEDAGHRILFERMEACWEALAASADVVDDAEQKSEMETRVGESEDSTTECVDTSRREGASPG